MALSVGVVTIEYDHNPPLNVQNFLRGIASGPGIDSLEYPDMDISEGEDGEEEYDEGIGYSCGTLDDEDVLNVYQAGLMERAINWCSEQGIVGVAQEELLNWLANLPWKYGYVRLHLVG